MLVYCSQLLLQPDLGPVAVFERVARWVARKTESYVDAKNLSGGLDQRLRDGSRIQSMIGSLDPPVVTFPYLASIRYSHGDPKVSGRQWSVEVGISQSMPDGAVTCSILSQTSEISARVVTPIQVTRPYCVEDIANHCKPILSTASLTVRTLDEANALAFLHSIERKDRTYPWVVVSPTREGGYLVDIERLRSFLVGLARIFTIPTDADTFQITRQCGAKYSAWLGGINIIFPPRHYDGRSYCESVRLLPDFLEECHDSGRPAENEVLSAVCHRMNLPNSWKHISFDVVASARLRRQLDLSIQKANQSDETAQYAQLLIEADREIKDKESGLAELRSQLEQSEWSVQRLEYDVESLKHALAGKRDSDENVSSSEAIAPLREIVLSALSGEASIAQYLQLVATLFSDRMVVLDSAMSAADRSSGFKYKKKAIDLLLELATSYWEALASGKGDDTARRVFGEAYAAKESDSLTNDGRKRRTFEYKGAPLEMMKHLKIGIKDSAAETLRVHFEWLAEERKIVIGYCGPHLDF